MPKTAPGANNNASDPARHFSGFGRGLFAFFAELEKNQNKEWFHANKHDYETTISGPMGLLIQDLSQAFEASGMAISGSAKTSVFRIHRDVRFSKDKSPYKTHISAALSEDGTKHGKGLLYLQIGGPEGAFMATGFYSPEPDKLKSIRQIIADEPKPWLKVEAALRKKGLALMADEALIRMPKGFEAYAESPVAATLKLKNFVVKADIPKALLHDQALVKHIAGFAKSAQPLIAFFGSAL
jgi:uncharacterized protein (TIGR02453 family)